MVMKRNKMILVVLISVLVIGTAIVSAFHLIDGGDGMMLTEEEGIELTAEQYQLLRDSILHVELEDMCNIERRNAWLILDAMAEIGFVENRSPSESGVSRATWILDMLGVGIIQELTVVRVSEGIHDLVDVLVIRILNTEGRTYYAQYNQTWGLGGVRKGSEDGEIIYSRIMHAIIDGQICRRESPRGAAICD